jgi:hypothetical protein
VPVQCSRSIRLDADHRRCAQGRGYATGQFGKNHLGDHDEKEFFADFDQFPYQIGSSLNAAGIDYGLLAQQAALKRLKDLEGLSPR